MAELQGSLLWVSPDFWVREDKASAGRKAILSRKFSPNGYRAQMQREVRKGSFVVILLVFTSIQGSTAEFTKKAA